MHFFIRLLNVIVFATDSLHICLFNLFVISRLLIIEIVVIVPSLRWAWIGLSEHKNQVIWAKLDWLLWISDHILNLFQWFLILLAFVDTLGHANSLTLIFELVIVDHLSPVETDWDYQSSCRQVVEQIRVLAICKLLGNLHMVKIRSGDIWEVLFPDRGSCPRLWLLGITYNQLLQDSGELWIVVSLA